MKHIREDVVLVLRHISRDIDYELRFRLFTLYDVFDMKRVETIPFEQPDIAQIHIIDGIDEFLGRVGPEYDARNDAILRCRCLESG